MGFRGLGGFPSVVGAQDYAGFKLLGFTWMGDFDFRGPGPDMPGFPSTLSCRIQI